MSYIMVYCTVDTLENSKRIANTLLETNLAACINIIPSICSIYKWEEKVVEDSECLLLIKSKKELFDKLKETIESTHPYTVPEIIGVDIAYGSEKYLEWIESNTL